MRNLSFVWAPLVVMTLSASAFAQVEVLPPPAEYRDPAPTRQRPFAFDFGVQGGINYWAESGPFGTNEGIGPGLAPGWHLGLRASFEFFSWLALDGRAQIMRDGANPVLKGGVYTTTGGLGAARFTIPFQHIRPYALIGFGEFHMAPSGAKTQLISDTTTAYVGGLGATIPTGRNVEVGVEYLYDHLNGEVLSKHKDVDGGDPSTLSFFLQYRLPL